MTLEQLVHQVESRLADLARALWRPDPVAELREEIAQMGREVRDRREALARVEAARSATAARLHDNQTASANLTSRVRLALGMGEGDQAWREALELDRVRQTLAEDRDILPRLERECASIQFHLRLLENRLRRLQDQYRPR